MTGRLSPTGDYTVQCTGRFPDYVDRVDPSYAGPRFVLSQDYPQQLPTNEPRPWANIPFKTKEGATAYLMAVRAYVYEGMKEVEFVLQDNKARRWYHVPWMTSGRHPREFVRGLTDERPLTGPELGLKPDVTVQNWAIGFYNSVGAYAIGKVWIDVFHPNSLSAQSPEGTVVAKLLFSAARPEDFSVADLLAGAPAWRANIFNGSAKKVSEVRLLQIDVAIRDANAGPTGWVFGTYAYDASRTDLDRWDRMMPVGLMWGNDPHLTDAEVARGVQPAETVVGLRAPLYAIRHLGRGGRMNGPVDNPVSACMSCHSTAQTVAVAPMTPPPGCTSDQVMYWFKNRTGLEAFGAIRNCAPVKPDPANPPTALDYSLQQAIAIANSAAPGAYNPCVPQPPKPGAATSPLPTMTREIPSFGRPLLIRDVAPTPRDDRRMDVFEVER